jgi:hypothetical protein
MVIAFAPFQLKDGITEQQLLAASDAFETDFVRHQTGILRRVLVRDDKSDFADIVFFDEIADINRVVEAERASDVCAAFFALMNGDGDHRVYEVLKTYEP